ncbi:MAG: methyltransferase domain-containing protein [Gemmatimonadaceae bacterium]|nr:methyltransferase domain-containing protein [Gemmatimonadaceae bacterium]
MSSCIPRLPSFESLEVDFLFSHHVLEHVDDLCEIVRDFARRVRPGG